MSHPLDTLFDDRCLTPEELQGMADGTLSGAALHRAERHLLDCPLCNEALDGLRAAAFDATNDFDALQHRINLRVRRTASPRTPFLRIAAILVVVAVAGGVAWYLVTVQRDEKLFSQYYEPYAKQAEPLPAPAAPAVTADEAQPEAPSAPSTTVRPVPKQPAETRPMAAAKKDAVAADEDLTRQEETPVVADVVSKTAATTAPEKEEKALARQKTPAAPAGQVQKEDIAFLQKGAAEEKETASDEVVTTREVTSRSAAPASTAAGAFKDMAPATLDVSQLQRAPLQEVIRLYEEKKYGEAFSRAEVFLKKFPGDAEGLFYAGISAMNDGRTRTASKRLKSCIDTGNSQWKEEASWYLALCYVKLDKIADARPLLQFLAGGRSVHAVEAQQLLQSLQ